MSSGIVEGDVTYLDSSMLIAVWEGQTYEAKKFEKNPNSPWLGVCTKCDAYPPEGIDGIGGLCIKIRCSHYDATGAWPSHPEGQVYWTLVESVDD